MATGVVLADQVSKFGAVYGLTTLFRRAGTVGLWPQVRHFYREGVLEHLARSPQVLVPGVVRLRYAENTGAAFSLFDTAPLLVRQGFFVVSMLLAIAFVAVMAWRTRDGATGRLWALGAILGGATGNFIDRVVHGYVIDFIDVLYTLPVHIRAATFNLADASITCGAAVLLAAILREARGP